MIWPASGVTAVHFADAMSRYYDYARDEHYKILNGDDKVNAYLKWVGDVHRLVRPVLQSDDIDRLLLTRRYWATLANPEPSPALLFAVQEEAQARVADLEQARNDAVTLRNRWTTTNDLDPTHIVVPDTNVFVSWCDEAAKKTRDIAEIDWRTPVQARTFDGVRVVIPLVVIDELELTKDKRQDVRGRQARKAVNTLFDWFEYDPDRTHHVVQRGPDTGEVTVELLADPTDHVALPRRDEELISRAVAVQELRGHKVHFLSYDTGAVLRAKRTGLIGHRLRAVHEIAGS